MGFLKKLYGEAQHVRKKGSIGKEVGQLRKGVPKRVKEGREYASKLRRKAYEKQYQIRMKFR